jgi:hypothetical protein
MFYQRIENAVKTRILVEQAQTYKQKVLSNQSEKVAPLPREIKLGILSRIGVPVTIKDMPLVVNFP